MSMLSSLHYLGAWRGAAAAIRTRATHWEIFGDMQKYVLLQAPVPRLRPYLRAGRSATGLRARDRAYGRRRAAHALDGRVTCACAYGARELCRLTSTPYYLYNILNFMPCVPERAYLVLTGMGI